MGLVQNSVVWRGARTEIGGRARPVCRNRRYWIPSETRTPEDMTWCPRSSVTGTAWTPKVPRKGARWGRDAKTPKEMVAKGTSDADTSGCVRPVRHVWQQVLIKWREEGMGARMSVITVE